MKAGSRDVISKVIHEKCGYQCLALSSNQALGGVAIRLVTAG